MTIKVGDRVWGDAGIKCEVLGFARFENAIQIKISCPGGERFITPADIRGHDPPPPIQVGDRVRKIRFLGWTGLIKKKEGESIYVLWHGDKHPTMEPADSLEPNVKPRKG